MSYGSVRIVIIKQITEVRETNLLRLINPVLAHVTVVIVASRCQIIA
jgi:hypothetical protein